MKRNITPRSFFTKSMAKQTILPIALMLAMSTQAQEYVDHNIYSIQGDEQITKRDLVSKHFNLEDGRTRAVIATRPIHYLNNGIYQDIDNRITATSNANYSFANVTNLMESHFGATADKGILNVSATGSTSEFHNVKMFWDVNGVAHNTINGAAVPVTVEGNKATYHDIFNTIDAEFKVLNGMRKLNYVIPNRAAIENAPEGASYLVFSEDVQMPANWSYTIENGDVYIYNNLGKNSFIYRKPVSKDLENRSTRNNTVFNVINNNNGSITIETKVATTWLLDENRQFPINVDPTIQVGTHTFNFATGTATTEGVKYDDEIVFGRIGDYNNAPNFARGFAAFDTTAIPDGSTITSGISLFVNVTDFSPYYTNANGLMVAISRIPAHINPQSASNTVLYTQIEQQGYHISTVNFTSEGWKEMYIVSNTLAADMTEQLAQNRTSLGFMPHSTGEGFYEWDAVVLDGDQNFPYMEMHYQEPSQNLSTYNKAFSMYPNPAQSVVTIEAEDQIQNVEIYSVIGQKVAQQAANQINVSALANGMYIMKVTFENGQVATQKFTKK